MGKILLNEEAFGGGGSLFGTTVPQSSEGEDGDIYFQYDTKLLIFNGERSTSRWNEPIIFDVDISNTTTVEFKGSVANTERNISADIADFYEEAGIMYYDIPNGGYLGYSINDLTKLYVYSTTGTTTKVNRIETITTGNTRIKDIFGKVNGEWLKYYPYENYLDKPTGA